MAVKKALEKIFTFFAGGEKAENSPILFSSPHSGRVYLEDFLRSVSVPLHILQRMEDRFVDSFLVTMAEEGDSVLMAQFPRSMCDVNRNWRELDGTLFFPPLPMKDLHITQKVRAGYGVIPRCAAPGHPIYRQLLPFEEAEKRIRTYWKPYHEKLSRALSEKHLKHHYAVLFDVHSMPKLMQQKPCDIVLGDCHGESCSHFLTKKLEEIFTQYGYKVQCNTPYAGGYITRSYGQPHQKYHALQIEICRSLYLNMSNLQPNYNFFRFQQDITHIFKEISIWIKENHLLLS